MTKEDKEKIKEMIGRLASIQIAHRVNVLDFVPQMNEDAHTKFLREILSHKRNGKQVFVQSFLKRMLDLKDEELNDDYKSEFEIEDQVPIEINGKSRRLDLRLQSDTDNRYIVVESKVKGAVDGNLQMADYLKHCEEQGKKDCLIYLTLAGGTPAEWSFGKDKENIEKLQKARSEKRYFERSYCDEVLTWLREDVLPNCLFSERMLYHSVAVYVDAVMRMVGGVNVDDVSAAQAKKLLSDRYGRECEYGDVIKLREYIENDLKKVEALVRSNDDNQETVRQREIVKMRQVRDVATNLRDWMLRDCIYLDPWFTAYHLKHLLRNKPTPQYRNLGEFNVGAFKSIGQFTYSGSRYIELVTQKGIRIHLECTPEGIKRGPYVFVQEMQDIGVSGDTFTRMEHFDGGAKSGRYNYSMDNFKTDTTKLVDVARHIERMIRELEGITSELANND